MREPGLLALLALVCGMAARGSLACARASSPGNGPAGAASAAEARDSASFAALAARAAAVAPGMREVARLRSSGDKVELARAGDRDACVRVAFEASAPIHAKLVDAAGNVLATSDAAVTDGVLGARGPVCVRKGNAVSAVAGKPDGGASVRWVAWQSP